MVTSSSTHVLAYRARFRGLRMKVLGVDQVVKCEPVIELRRLSVRSQLFGIFYAATGRRLNLNGYTLRDAKAIAESQFDEKLDDWHEVAIPFGDLLSEGK